MISLLKQLVMTVLVLLVGLAGLVWIKPDIGREILASDIPMKEEVRQAILLVAPEAGEPAPERAGAPGRGAFGAGGDTPVVAAPVTEMRAQSELKALASAQAVRSVTVYADNTSGVIEEVLVASGEAVEAGQPLVRLERSSQTVALDRAELAVRSAEDKLTRFRQLLQRNAATSVELSDVERERDAAMLDLREARIALSKREIRAPIDGRVGILDVERGTLVESSTVIATIDARDELKLVFYTPERFLSDIDIGTTLSAVSVARPQEVYSGRITAIDSRVAEDSRTVRTEGVIANEGDRLRPGMAFAVTMPLEGETYLATDPLAVVWERTGPFVWAVREDKAVKAPVRIVERQVDHVLVVSDNLKAGDIVVVEGVQSMRDGLDVDVELRDVGEAPQTAERPEGTDVSSAASPAPAPALAAAAATSDQSAGASPQAGGEGAMVPLPRNADRSGS
ncbi:efflux RND transporter periplasmic adaptor subunit [Fulvimarina endophytica]|uniref:Efflux RND transporter periplasmic adaptor subunit n=1 Tax=Fulvimarina endophytica TaxID=2293836 RepID=A0A371X5T1_9HYPH|nr:efflux RND transporter periplasmic adaptor subunit [Fulvimarina endophytica]RFC64582.1 efflux RND transporter periplasmic adaptor subunit [Fulvimarina endophytica]